jgi:hypothetical protein
VSDLDNRHDHAATLDRLVGEITASARDDDGKLWAFRRALEEHVALPVDAFVVGEPVSLIRFSYDGNTRRGLTATCRRPDGGDHVMSAGDVVLAPHAAGARYLAAL